MLSDQNESQEYTYIGEKTKREIARLIRQDSRFTQEAGDVLEGRWSTIHRVLDIGCGPGGWLLEMARQHPHIAGIGIDSNPDVLSIARTLARAEQRANVRFLKADAREPLEFPDSSFDLVHGRLLNSFLTPQSWPHLINESARLLSPGGILCMTEYEMATSTSQVMEVIFSRMYESLKRVGRSHSASSSTGVACVLPNLFRRAGFQNIQLKGICLDVSHEAEGFSDWMEDIILMSHTFRDFVVATGIATAEEMDRSLEEGLREMEHPDFGCVSFHLCVIGTKPSQESGQE